MSQSANSGPGDKHPHRITSTVCYLYPCSLGKVMFKRLQELRECRPAFMFPVNSPIAHIMLQGLRHADALGGFAGGFDLAGKSSELRKFHAVEIQRTVHDSLRESIVLANKLLRSVEL